VQFFIIHPDFKRNAELLPDYAIIKVNVREGWQIISDIGHNLGVTWEGQNKAYSIWHAETRRFMVNRKSFQDFINHYRECLKEYTNRTGKETVFHKKFNNDSFVSAVGKIYVLLPENRTHEEFMASYLLRGKTNKLTQKEIDRIESIC
jgi:hypothetical protein